MTAPLVKCIAFEKIFSGGRRLAAFFATILCFQVLHASSRAIADGESSGSHDPLCRLYDVTDFFCYRRVKEKAHSDLADTGIVGLTHISRLPAYKDLFFQSFSRFIRACEDVRQSAVSTEGPNQIGWSCGIENFNGVTDTLKSSYYIPVDSLGRPRKDSLWPTETWEHYASFVDDISDIINSMFNYTQHLIPALKGLGTVSATARLLYYKPLADGLDDPNPHWCGRHRDHGFMTCLLPAIYMDPKTHERLLPPEDAGLYVNGTHTGHHDDTTMLFQVGEALDLLSGNRYKATEHFVKKPALQEGAGIARMALALFIDIPDDTPLKAQHIADYCLNRYVPDMTYAQWCQASLAQYVAGSEGQ